MLERVPCHRVIVTLASRAHARVCVCVNFRGYPGGVLKNNNKKGSNSSGERVYYKYIYISLYSFP